MKRTYWAMWLKLMLTLVMVLTLTAGPCAAGAEETQDPLKPADVTSEDGNIILHKQAERIGPDEWEVNVSAEVKEIEVDLPELQVAFILDRTTSMNMCTYEEDHNYWFENYTSAYFHFLLGHDQGNCYCPKDHEEHTSACCSLQLIRHNSNKNCYIKVDGKEQSCPSRISVAMEAIRRLDSSLPAGTDKMYFSFSGANKETGAVDYISDTITQTVEGVKYGPDLFLNVRGTMSQSEGTKVKAGVEAFFQQSEGHTFAKNSKQKVLILVTDGASDDGYPVEVLQDFKNNQNGIVFTVGFNHDDPRLKALAGTKDTINDSDKDAYYIHADSADSILNAFSTVRKSQPWFLTPWARRLVLMQSWRIIRETRFLSPAMVLFPGAQPLMKMATSTRMLRSAITLS